MSAPFGFVNAFKPPGPSSAAFGNWVKRLASGVAVGHWGTLDPRACGVLVLAVGKATRLLPLITDTSKSYVFELVVGEQTDTGDAAGQVIARATVGDIWRRQLPSAIAALRGPQLQLPPMYSAVKVSGSPLYRAARAGANVPRVQRAITIRELRILPDEADGPTARLFVRCDAGTYVRVLCEDLGKQLDLPARMGALLRVASGPFDVNESMAPADIARSLDACLLDPLRVLPQRRYELDTVRARRFCAGNEIVLENVGSQEAREAQNAVNDDVLVTHDGTLVGTGMLIRRDDKAMLAPTRVVAAAGQGS